MAWKRQLSSRLLRHVKLCHAMGWGGGGGGFVLTNMQTSVQKTCPSCNSQVNNNAGKAHSCSSGRYRHICVAGPNNKMRCLTERVDYLWGVLRNIDNSISDHQHFGLLVVEGHFAVGSQPNLAGKHLSCNSWVTRIYCSCCMQEKTEGCL